MGTKTTWIVLAALLPAASFGQFDFGGGDSGKPWDSLKLDKKTRIKLEFRGSNIDSIIQLYQKISGVTIVKDPNLTGPFTITSAKAVPLADAFQILASTLTLKGFDVAREGKLLVIKKRAEAPAGGRGGFDPSALATMFSGANTAKSELKVYPIQYAAASQVARVLNDVFAQDQAGGGTGFPFAFGGGGGGGGRRFNFPGMGGGSGNKTTLKASSDDFSNSVIVNAPSEDQRQVQELITKLDKQTDQPQKSVVYKLVYAAAPDLLTTVQNVLTSNAPKGRGNSGQNQNGGGGGFFAQIFGGGQNRAAQSQASADSRSNSIIVTATDDVQGIVNRVLKELDTEVAVSSSTVVIPLQNAKADDVAGLLTKRLVSDRARAAMVVGQPGPEPVPTRIITTTGPTGRRTRDSEAKTWLRTATVRSRSTSRIRTPRAANC